MTGSTRRRRRTNPAKARADSGVVATAVFHRTLRMASGAAEVLGLAEEAAGLAALADFVRDAFNRHYVDDDGRVHSDCPTVYALAIVFELLEVDTAQRAGDRLAELVRADGHHIATGFAGTPYVLDALTMTGYVADAYALLLQTECPSWLFPVDMGATTIWERWDSMLPDGSVNPGEMTSFNHYALGAVVDWLHRTVGGLAPLEPGYRRIRVAPRPGGGLTHAETSLATPHGAAVVAWTATDGRVATLDVTVPEGTSAVVVLDGHEPTDLEPGTHRLAF